MGLLIVVAGGAYIGSKVIPERKPDHSDLATQVLEQARAYQLLVEENKRLSEVSQKAQLGAKDSEIVKLQTDLAEAKAKLQQSARRYEADLLRGPRPNNDLVKSLPTAAIDAWTRCIEGTGTSSGHAGCDAILQQGVFDVSSSRARTPR